MIIFLADTQTLVTAYFILMNFFLSLFDYNNPIFRVYMLDGTK